MDTTEREHKNSGAIRPSLVVDVFEIAAIDRLSHPSNLRCAAATLSRGDTRCTALVGTAATQLVIGQQFRIRRCLLWRQGKTVLIVCSAKPIDLHQEEDE